MDLLIVFIVGIVFGSFFNVVAMRLLDQKEKQEIPAQFISGRSMCPKCGHNLKAIDLIPLISYLILLGRCRYCRTMISPLYFIGELIAGITFVSIYYNVGLAPELLVHLSLGTLLVISTITDLREKVVLNKIVVFFAVLVMILRVFLHVFANITIWYYLGSGVILFLLLFAVMVFSGNKMGGGDVKLYGIIGLSIGIVDAFASLFFASIFGLLLMVPGMLLGKVTRKTEIPFVPFIWGGVIITYFIDVISLSIYR